MLSIELFARSGEIVGVEIDSEGSVVNKLYLHVGAEFTVSDMCDIPSGPFDELLVELSRRVWIARSGERGTIAFAAVGIEREL